MTCKISVVGLNNSSALRCTVPSLFDSTACLAVPVSRSLPFLRDSVDVSAFSLSSKPSQHNNKNEGDYKPNPALKAFIRAKGNYKRQMVAKGRRPKPAEYKQLFAALSGSQHANEHVWRLGLRSNLD